MVTQENVSRLASGNESAQQLKKVLNVSQRYGKDTLLEGVVRAPSQELVFEKQALAIFEQEGFTVVRGGIFNPDNPFELGINAHIGKVRAGMLRLEEIARNTGAELPSTILDAADILKMNAGVVAKLPGRHKGIGKVLLDTQDKKARFLAFVWLGQSVVQLHERSDEIEIVDDLVEKIKAGQSIARGERLPGKEYIFQEFIDTPSPYNTSFRIVADAHGEIHYGLLLFSASQKGYQPDFNTMRMKYIPLDEVYKREVRLHALPFHPDSPFFVASTLFVSNYAQGGRAILLNGQPIIDFMSRDVLIMHGINPDKPSIPEPLLALSSRIGKERRSDFPYVGVDFLQSKDDKYYLLEANVGPEIDPEEINLPLGTSPEECQLELMRKVAQYTPQS